MITLSFYGSLAPNFLLLRVLHDFFFQLWFVYVSLLDVVNQESIEKSVEEVSKLVQEEGLNCLINNAGINVVADFHSVTAEMMIENFHTNTVAPLMITKVNFIYILCASCHLLCFESAT